jgi:hypothetical protein
MHPINSFNTALSQVIDRDFEALLFGFVGLSLMRAELDKRRPP